MFTYSGQSAVRMAKRYRAEESADVPRSTRARKLRSPRLAPPSILTSPWWVSAEGLRAGLGSRRHGTARPA
jgi:hypothetical protein